MAVRVCCLCLLVCLAGSPAAASDIHRVLGDHQLPADVRLEPLKDLDGYFPFHPPATIAQWEQEKHAIRQRMLVACGLWPAPTRTPLKAVIHGLHAEDDYTVEKVFFESMPDFFVTGNLYRPKSAGRHPGVLCPHGHWNQGRFYDTGEESARGAIVRGEERFEAAARSPLQARCVQLARMGCVVFHYDMIGYADSTQISYELAHRFARQRPEMNAPDNWGLFSPQAETHLQSVMGLQTYNSIRALDFLAELPDVDPQRLGVTGASGGGTQTFMLSALDSRVGVSVPAVMVSTAMQGGCTCENACLLRVGRGNIDFAAVFAPRPLCLIAADDWTREIARKGYPELTQLYRLLEAEDQVQLHAFLQFPHNYNHVSRAAMYLWINRHFQLGHAEPILETDFRRLSSEEMTVWDPQHPHPQGGPDFERKLLAWWDRDAQQQLDAIHPRDEATLQRYRDVVGAGLDVVLGRRPPAAAAVEFEARGKTQLDELGITRGMLSLPSQGEQLPLVLIRANPAIVQAGDLPKPSACVIWLTGRGKAGLFTDDGQLRPEVIRLAGQGAAIIGVDLFQQGEFRPEDAPLDSTRRVANTREAAAYTFGYNHSLFAQRVHDVLTAITYARQWVADGGRVYLVGIDGAGPWAVAARAQAGEAVQRAVVQTAGFRFAEVRQLHAPEFLPGGARYHDLPGMLAVAAPAGTWVMGEEAAALDLVRDAYRAAGQAESLRAGDDWQAALEWLVEK